ncbi:hypothetical protein CKALI_00920 [Corynebacterium kalinowskii]|uniref:Uncharacterized protein n=1 Tax=Corynebacterium kalinowskii TaxID=2675216 RepID=A0A6B8VPX8_9CORY|nr:hypothetical protein [Corynebacterium kalinowskii]QGU01085.1 hypothetical protein CKALI_00920 [Corynebacterium kalinowskii]
MRSLILWAGVRGANVYRHIGVNDTMCLDEFRRVLDVCFGFDSAEPSTFPGLHPSSLIPDNLTYEWGLWIVDIHVIDAYPRDEGTPRALCIGGAGSLNDDFDLATVNTELTGRETLSAVLSLAHPELRDLIERGSLYDFVPLLQALDLRQAFGTSLGLPLEIDPAARDAFWVTVLVLSCFSEPETSDSLLEGTMAELGWVEDDGTPLTAPAIRALCAASLTQLAALGAYGRHAKSPVDRLEIYRNLLAG